MYAALVRCKVAVPQYLPRVRTRCPMIHKRSEWCTSRPEFTGFSVIDAEAPDFVRQVVAFNQSPFGTTGKLQLDSQQGVITYEGHLAYGSDDGPWRAGIGRGGELVHGRRTGPTK